MELVSIMHGVLVIHAKKINKTGKEDRKCIRLGYSFIMCVGTALQISVLGIMT